MSDEMDFNTWDNDGYEIITLTVFPNGDEKQKCAECAEIRYDRRGDNVDIWKHHDLDHEEKGSVNHE